MRYDVESSWTTLTFSSLSVTAGSVNLSTDDSGGRIDMTDKAWSGIEVEAVLTAFDPGTLRIVELHALARMSDGSTYPDYALGGSTMCAPPKLITDTSSGNTKELQWLISNGGIILLGPHIWLLGVGNGCSNNMAGGTVKYRKFKFVP